MTLQRRSRNAAIRCGSSGRWMPMAASSSAPTNSSNSSARARPRCGRLWSEIAKELKLDPDNQVARAIATHETWSGIEISWPVDEFDDRLPVELSGLPIFDRDRSFRGYRGFGVCRDVARINQSGAHAPGAADRLDAGLVARRSGRSSPSMNRGAARPASEPRHRRPLSRRTAARAASDGRSEPVTSAPPQPAAECPAPRQERHPNTTAAGAVAPAPPTSCRFVRDIADAKAPSLSAMERNAFRELAQELTARLRGTAPRNPNRPSAKPLPRRQLAEAPHASAEAASASAAPAAADAPVEAAVADTPQPSAETDTRHRPTTPMRLASRGRARRHEERALLDRLPAGILVHRNDTLLYANRHFLELSGYDTLDALAAAGGLNSLFAGPGAGAPADGGARTEALDHDPRAATAVPVEGRLFTVPWNGASALALSAHERRGRRTPAARHSARSARPKTKSAELKSILERTARREARRPPPRKPTFSPKSAMKFARRSTP